MAVCISVTSGVEAVVVECSSSRAQRPLRPLHPPSELVLRVQNLHRVFILTSSQGASQSELSRLLIAVSPRGQSRPPRVPPGWHRQTEPSARLPPCLHLPVDPMRQIAAESRRERRKGKRVCGGRMWFTGVEAALLSHRGGWHCAAPRFSAVHVRTAEQRDNDTRPAGPRESPRPTAASSWRPSSSSSSSSCPSSAAGGWRC